MIRLFLSLGTLVFMVAMVATGTVAFFGDNESSTGNTFTAGVLDLLIDNESYYNGNVCADVNDDPEIEDWQWQGEADYPVPGTPCTTSFVPSNLPGLLFFDFNDVKPGDNGEDTISIHVQNDAWVCMDLTLTSDDDNSSNEPELETGDPEDDANDAWDGELADALQFFWWADDGDNVYEAGENAISNGVETLTDLATTTGSFQMALADAATNVWGEDGPIPANETVYIAKAWCVGTLTLDPVGAGEGVNPSVDPGVDCDGALLGNELQTDGVEISLSFNAVQARNDTEFLCEVELEECELVETFADEIISADQGLRKNGSAVTADRSDPTYALGAPQSLGTPYDNPVVPNSFFSLGFPFLPDNPAEIVLAFNNNLVVDGPGNDLKLWEVTGGSNYPDERVDVFVGDNPLGPWTLVGDDVTRDAEIDINPIASARYVRIVDTSNVALFEDTADGYDLDAVQALNCVFREEVEN